MAANGISTETVGSPIDWTATKAKRRDDKLALAEAKRQAIGTQGYRPYNVYVSPGTVSPANGHPWVTLNEYGLLLENDLPIETEAGEILEQG